MVSFFGVGDLCGQLGQIVVTRTQLVICEQMREQVRGIAGLTTKRVNF